MNIALITAGGTGSRMGKTSVPKQFLCAQSKPIIVHTIEHFQQSKMIDAIIVVCVSTYIKRMLRLKQKYGLSKVKSIIPGGMSGQESIYFGLKEANLIAPKEEDNLVLIHDSVRPLISVELIESNIRCATEKGSCITVSPLKESVLTVSNDSVSQVLLRNNCYFGRAPQTFFLKNILECHEKSIRENNLKFIDSAMMMKHYGYDLAIIEGPDENIKITTPIDYYLFKAILDARENNQIVKKI